MQKNQTHLVRYIETLAANAWRPAVEQHLDGWRLRVTGGSSSRVNSVWPNRHYGDLKLGPLLEIVEDFYRRHSMPPCFQMCAAALPENLAGLLERRGYQDEKHTAVKTAAVESVLALVERPRVKVQHSSQLTEEWFTAYTSASEYSAESLPIRLGILSRIGPEANFLLLKVDGEAAATGLGVVERSWLGVFCMVTYADFRRQGLASQVMHALVSWGQDAGAEQVYLQVMENNPPALAMYEKLGFDKKYLYWYAQLNEDEGKF